MMRCRLGVLLTLGVLAAVTAACGDGDPAPPTTAALTPDFERGERVVVTMTTGCDRPVTGGVTEALALVSVTYDDGSPAIGADVHGTLTGPGVRLSEAVDEVAPTGEALLFFTVDAPGRYTVTVDRVVASRALPLPFDDSSERFGTIDVGEDCTPP